MFLEVIGLVRFGAYEAPVRGGAPAVDPRRSKTVAGRLPISAKTAGRAGGAVWLHFTLQNSPP